MWAPRLDATEALRAETRHFVESIEQRRAPVTDGEAGLRVVRLVEAATQSVASRGRLIEFTT
jgi:predicted dehydrogenase